MKKKTEFVLSYLCLLLLLTLGVGTLLTADREERISNEENRMLQGFPPLTAQTVLDGSFMTRFEDFLSDGFPLRYRAVSLSEAMMGLFGREDETEKLKAAVDEEMMGDAEDEPEPLPLSEAPAPTEAALPELTRPMGEESTPGETHDAAFWYITEDGQRRNIETYPAENIRYVAGVLNQYRACLPEDGTVHVINTPVSSIANLLMIKRYYADWDYTLDDEIRPLLDEGVIFYDPTEVFRETMYTEDVYSTDDHHWHVKGALIAANTMLQNIGYNPEEFFEYRYWLMNSIRNGSYSPEQLQSMERDREDLMVVDTVSPVDPYTITHLTELEPSVYLSFQYTNYSMYMGGPHGPYRYFITGFHTGRNCLVIGDSFTRTFVPYLLPYYDHVLTTDPRNTNYRPDKVGASMKQYIQEYDIDDVYIITCTLSNFNDAVFTWRLETFLNTDYGAQS